MKAWFNVKFYENMVCSHDGGVVRGGVVATSVR